jgi:hypothetical protein
MVRIDVAGIYHARQFKGGILVTREEFAQNGVWEDYCGSKFYAWATQHRY